MGAISIIVNYPLETLIFVLGIIAFFKYLVYLDAKAERAEAALIEARKAPKRVKRSVKPTNAIARGRYTGIIK